MRALVCRNGDGGSEESSFWQYYYQLYVCRGRDSVGTNRELAEILANVAQGLVRARVARHFLASAHPGIGQVTLLVSVAHVSAWHHSCPISEI